MFETIQPLKSERDNLKAQIDVLTNEFAAQNEKSQNLKFNLESEIIKNQEIHENFEKIKIDYEQARDLGFG